MPTHWLIIPPTPHTLVAFVCDTESPQQLIRSGNQGVDKDKERWMEVRRKNMEEKEVEAKRMKWQSVKE